MDYDLLPSDPSKLDNLYLMDASRYTLKEVKNHNSPFTHPKVSEKKAIPGEIFVLNMCNLVNINVSYLLSEKGFIEQKVWAKFLFRTMNITILALIVLSMFPVFYQFKSIDNEYYLAFHQNARWLDKILLLGVVAFLLGLPMMHKDKETGNYTNSWAEVGLNALVMGVIAVVFLLVYFLV